MILYAWSITAVVRVFFLYVYFSYNGFHSSNMFDKNCTLSLPIPTLSANLYDLSYYACVCGYPIHALKLLACTLKLLPCTVKLLPCTVKLLANAVKFLPRTVKLLANAVKFLPCTVKHLPRTVKHLYSTVTFYLYARNSPECWWRFAPKALSGYAWMSRRCQCLCSFYPSVFARYPTWL